MILDVFFTLHDPRQRLRRGSDVGTQYRSGTYHGSDQQQERFQAATECAAATWDGPVATEVEPLGVFFRAEEHHQDFFVENADLGYCLAVALPKVNTVRRSHAQYVRAA